jgi:prepilin-type N-terminal cleavage/methylation domain-containing protein
MKEKRGFSLIESLIALSLLLILILLSSEFFGSARTLFFKLKAAEEESQAALAALEKMKIDLSHAGFGLLTPIELGVLGGVTQTNGVLRIESSEKTLSIPEDLVEGQMRLSLEGGEELKPGREVCIFDSNKAETKIISAVEAKAVVLSSPLLFSYRKEESSLCLLEKISLYLDQANQMIRRKVNSSSPQPLLDDVVQFDANYDQTTNLAKLQLSLKTNQEKKYETSVFPKNTGLALAR